MADPAATPARTPIRRVLIADDEPLARERVSVLLRQQAPDVEISFAGNGADTVAAILAGRPDAVFLDVQMPEGDGFDVVARVGADRMPPTVFVTAFHEHALRAFSVAAVDYLLKPFDDVRFGAAWSRLVERTTLHAIRDESRRLATLLHALGGAESGSVPAATSSTAPAADAGAPGGERFAERLVVKRDQRTSVVPVSGVQWVESSGNYVVLHAGRERHELRETLTSLESRLDPARFVRIHRRVLVSIEAVRELQPWFGGDQVLLLKDGTKLRVSRSYREQFAQRLAGR